jgi:hypothetical protein
MKWLFRPSLLVVVSAALALSAMALVLWPRPLEDKAAPLSVQDGDQEIVWLYAATSPGPWERFIKGVDTVVERLQSASSDLGMEIDKRSAFPAETTTVPEVVLSAKRTMGRLRFRWYKLTSDLKTQDWVQALLERRPPPLAIIGGSSSDLGIELAQSLKDEAMLRNLGSASPLLLLSTATADDDPSKGDRPLSDIYTGRTFRFCFTNRQMAEAVVDFIWGQNDLRPDGDPVWLTYWNDDPYSKDLMQRYLDALQLPATQAAAQDWARLASFAAMGGSPFDGVGVAWGQFRLSIPAYTASIPYSIGTFSRPNRWELDEAGRLIKMKLKDYPQQRRPLLVLPAATQPSRRFLRALVRFAPMEARRFVVATGDSLAFNTLYRDRNSAWPIQDLPFPLVCFFHRNPMDQVDPDVRLLLENATRATEISVNGPTPTGTEDLLLYVDILDALVQATFCGHASAVPSSVPASADELKGKLSQVRWLKTIGRVSFDPANPPLFDERGDRRSGTGEHIVTLRPIFEGGEVLPAAKIEVWAWQTGSPAGERHWQRQVTLPVHYDGYLEQESDLEGDTRR